MSNFRVYNNTLCPDLWDEYQHLDPVVRLSLIKLAQDFYEKTGMVAPIIDIYLMGSIANFNWTPDSDADVHVIVDFTKFQMPEDTANSTARTAGSQWNLEHNIMVKNHKVEMNIQNFAEKKPHVTGIYSLTKDEWVRKPSHQSAAIDKSLVQVKYEGMKKYILASVASKDEETMEKTKNYINAFRQYGLDTAGELSIENIVFKILRAKGMIKYLKDAIISTYDSDMSVAENLPISGEEKYSKQEPGGEMMAVNLEEISQKDVKARYPQPDALFKNQYGKPTAGNWDFSKLTMGNLKSMRDKSYRFIKFYKKYGDFDAARREMDTYKRFDAELKKRMSYVNAPVTEMADITRDKKKVYANNSPLKTSDIEAVKGNIVFFRVDKGTMFAPGYTLVYFMDSDQAAQDMKDSKIVPLMVPRGVYRSGGNPITDVWKQKYHKPGTEHILGLLEGSTNEQMIYIDMISVRPGWKRNSIAKKMLEILKLQYPDAEITTSGQTDDGKKFFNTQNAKAINESIDSSDSTRYWHVTIDKDALLAGKLDVPHVTSTYGRKGFHVWNDFEKAKDYRDWIINKRRIEHKPFIQPEIIELNIPNSIKFEVDTASRIGAFYTTTPFDPKWIVGSQKITEACDFRDLYIGYVLDDFRVVGIRADSESNAEHSNLLIKYPDISHHRHNNGWRYRRDLNTVFWWDELPNEDERETLDQWILKNTGKKKPTHKVMRLGGGYNDTLLYKQSHGIDEGYGLGHNPEKDRLSIPDHRWQIRSKDAPKTPKMDAEVDTLINEMLDSYFK